MVVTGIDVLSGCVFAAMQEHFVIVVFKMNCTPHLLCSFPNGRLKSNIDDKT